MNLRPMVSQIILGFIVLYFADFSCFSQVGHDATADVQMYYRALHIVAMLLIGFGFLMVFVRGYGLSALTATYMMVAVAFPGYVLMKSGHLFGALFGLSVAMSMTTCKEQDVEIQGVATIDRFSLPWVSMMRPLAIAGLLFDLHGVSIVRNGVSLMQRLFSVGIDPEGYQ